MVKINLVQESDITDFIKGYISLKALDFLPKNIRNINEELDILNNNFYLLTKPNNKEISKNRSNTYKFAWFFLTLFIIFNIDINI